MKEILYKKLLNLGESDQYPFHMPGHKRNMKNTPYYQCSKMDITEIEGYDNLHHPEGIIEEEQRFVANLYHSEQSFYLVGGSTSGVLTAICAATNDNERILMARNSHKSAYNAAYLKNLFIDYLIPQQPKKFGYPLGMILPDEVEDKMRNTGAKVVFITSPSYEGIISDISKIAEVVHKYNGILIVDEAHGAHLGFHSSFPESAISSGADIVVQSLHKTMPALTMTALLHVCSKRVSLDNIRFYMSLFQTSSPSYVLMSSMSYCTHIINDKGNELFEDYKNKLQKFHKLTKNLNNLHILDRYWASEEYKAKMDPSKIIICADQLFDEQNKIFNGNSLAHILLYKYHIQIEMVSEKYVIAMTSIMDTKEGFDRLAYALKEIDQMVHLGKTYYENKIENGCVDNLSKKNEINIDSFNIDYKIKSPEVVYSIKTAIDGMKEKINWKDCINRVSAEYIYLYPPGSPIIVPGEMISEQVWNTVEHYKKQNMNIQGTSDYTMTYIDVCKTL